jgi:hypothetical protein
MSVFTLRRSTGGSALRDADSLRVAEISVAVSLSASSDLTGTGQALREGTAVATVVSEVEAGSHVGSPALTVTSVFSASGIAFALVVEGSLTTLPSLILIGGHQ